MDACALFSQFHVDKERLKANIDAVLAEAEQTTLAEVTAAYPVSQGLAEIVAYYELATESDWGEHQPGRPATDFVASPGRQHPRGDHRTDHLRKARMNPAANFPSPAETDSRTPEELPGVVTRLFKGVLYAETDEKLWHSLLGLPPRSATTCRCWGWT